LEKLISMAPDRIVNFRFYEELNDFLPKEKRKIPFTYVFKFNQTVKDAIEALGVPHAEVDLILVNGKSQHFNYTLKNGDHISVYPVFESLDISDVTKLRENHCGNPDLSWTFIWASFAGICACWALTVITAMIWMMMRLLNYLQMNTGSFSRAISGF